MSVATPSATRGKPAPSVRSAAAVAPAEPPIPIPPVSPFRAQQGQIATDSARVSAALVALQEVLLKRFQITVADLVGQLSESGVRHALEQNTGFESLEVALGDLTVHAAAESGSERVERLRDLHRAQADLLVRAGGAASATDAGELLGGVTRQAVEKRRERGTLLALNIQREFRYPLFQFEQSAILEGLPDVLKAFTVRNEWTQLSVLLSPQDALDGRSIIDALRAGEVKEAAAVAASFGNTGS